MNLYYINKLIFWRFKDFDSALTVVLCALKSSAFCYGDVVNE